MNSKSYEVYFNDVKIQVKNLFKSFEIDKNEFEKVEKTFFSPLYFKLKTKRHSFYFKPKASSAIGGVIDVDSVLKQMNEALRG